MVDPIITGIILNWLRKLGGLAVNNLLHQKLESIQRMVGKTEADRLRQILSDHADAKDGLTDQGLFNLATWVAANRQCVGIFFSWQSQKLSLLDRYAFALNQVIDQMKKIDLPMVVQGFLHSANCVTFFNPDSPISGRGDVRRDGNKLVFPKPDVDIYILNGETTDERVKSLNSAIVTAEYNRLPPADYQDSCRVIEVNQSFVYLKPQQDWHGVVYDDDKKSPIPKPIPDAAGLVKMLESTAAVLETHEQRLRQFEP